MDANTPETLSTAQRLANAERELELFERQPPLGARTYLQGRNAWREIIVELRQELEA